MAQAQYRIVPIDGITRTTVEGTLDFEASAAVLRAVAAENAEAGRHLLVDLRAAEAPHLDYRDVHRLVAMLADHPDAFRGKVALLDRYRKSFEKAQFFEAAAEVGGFHARAFLDEAAAVAWLERDAG